MILVDANVIIDVLSRDATWSTWSEAALRRAADRDEIAINPIIYAEIAPGFATVRAVLLCRTSISALMPRCWASSC